MQPETEAQRLAREDRAAARAQRTRQHLRAASKGFAVRENADDDRVRLQAAADQMLADARNKPHAKRATADTTTSGPDNEPRGVIGGTS